MTSRPAPPIVVPLLHDGVRYEPHASITDGPRPERTGGLAAFDVASGARLWSVTLWTIREEPGAPPHPGRYVGRIAVGPGPDDVLVDDEHGARFVVDRVALTMRELPRVDAVTRIRR